MTTLQANGQLPPAQIRQREDGQVVAEVFPANLLDRLLYWGYRGEVWLEPGTAPTQGRIYREPTDSKVALIWVREMYRRSRRWMHWESYLARIRWLSSR
jgi:hypothetical protein